MNQRLLLILLIISFSLTGLNGLAVPQKWQFLVQALVSLGNGIMAALALFKNPDGTPAKSSRTDYIAPRDLDEK